MTRILWVFFFVFAVVLLVVPDGSIRYRRAFEAYRELADELLVSGVDCPAVLVDERLSIRQRMLEIEGMVSGR